MRTTRRYIVRIAYVGGVCACGEIAEASLCIYEFGHNAPLCVVPMCPACIVRIGHDIADALSAGQGEENELRASESEK